MEGKWESDTTRAGLRGFEVDVSAAHRLEAFVQELTVTGGLS